MSLIYDGVYLIDGKKITQLKHSPDGYVLFNFNDVIDGVQYSRDAENPKMFDEIIYAGFAGVGLQKYTGKSIERENPITGDAGYDTDNSSVDFVINNSPTPGFQHQKENNPPGSK